MGIPKALHEIALQMQMDAIANNDGIVVVADESENVRLDDLALDEQAWFVTRPKVRLFFSRN